MPAVLWLSEVKKDDVAIVGGKGANLGEMYNAGFPVPEAFVVTADAFSEFVVDKNLRGKILELLNNVNVNSEKSLEAAYAKIKAWFNNEKMSPEMETEIAAAYQKLGSGDDCYVAVRSSATAEDLPEASFAGQQETFLNVRGKVNVINAVKKCWASLYTPRAIFYRVENNFRHEDVKIAVVVQKMVDPDAAGVMFTSDPVSGEKKVLIEAAYGLGEAVVGGKIIPDTYVVSHDLKILDKKIGNQAWMLKRKGNSTVRLELRAPKSSMQKISDDKIRELAKLGIEIEKYYGKPMDVEWCIEGENVYVVQARDVTTIKRSAVQKESSVMAVCEASGAARARDGDVASAAAQKTAEEAEVILRGLPASPGVAVGRAVKISSAEELDKVKKGDVLVTVMTSPDMVPAMRRAVAILTDEGGMTCHAAIVSRELGIPCIVGTTKATTVLNEGDLVTVDATRGVVYRGRVSLGAKAKALAGTGARAAEIADVAAPVTGTKILLNLGVPEKAEEYASLPVDGVGLMREEFIVSSYIGEHPIALIEKGEGKKFIEVLADGIAKVARAFYPRPVVLRTSDFKTNEYRALKGGEKYEVVEANPMIGWRGCSRYVSPNFREAFKLELLAIKKVREEYNLKNVWVMLPFVRTVEEVVEITKMMEAVGIRRGKDFKLWIMAEVPSNIFMADQFAKHCDGFSIGSNDLTQLIMGADRDREILAKMGYFDERNEAVKRAISHLIKTAHEHGCTVSICGQAPSVYPEFTEFLIREGIDSISLNADVVVKARRLVAAVERKIMLEGLRKCIK